MKTYTISERAKILYQTAVEVFDYNSTSDVITPPKVIQSQLDSLPTLGGKVLIPGAGIGSYVTALIDRNVKPENIYAIELSPAYFDLGAGLFSRLGVNYIHANFLTWEPEMQFDVIVGNPPFQNGGNSSYYTLFFKKIQSLIAKDGYFSLISPSKAAAPFSKGYKELAKLGWNQVRYGLDVWFPNIEQPIAIYSGRDKANETETLEVVDNEGAQSLPRGTVLPVQYVAPSKEFPSANINLSLGIFEKFFKGRNKLKERFETLSEAPEGNYVYLTSVGWRYHPAREKGGPYALLTLVNDCDKYMNGKFMQFGTEYEAEQMHWLLSRSLAYRFVAGGSCRSKFLPRVLLEETPDYSGVTSDKELFDLIGLTPEEISYIEMWNQTTAGK